MLSQRNFLPDNPSPLFPVHRLLHSTHPKWTPDRRGYARLLSSLKIQVPRCCVMVDYFENSLPHRIFATCLKTKIPPPPHPPPTKGRKARVNFGDVKGLTWVIQAEPPFPAYSRRQKEALFTGWNGRGLSLISHHARESGIPGLRIRIIT